VVRFFPFPFLSRLSRCMFRPHSESLRRAARDRDFLYRFFSEGFSAVHLFFKSLCPQSGGHALVCGGDAYAAGGTAVLPASFLSYSHPLTFRVHPLRSFLVDDFRGPLFLLFCAFRPPPDQRIPFSLHFSLISFSEGWAYVAFGPCLTLSRDQVSGPHFPFANCPPQAASLSIFFLFRTRTTMDGDHRLLTMLRPSGLSFPPSTFAGGTR